MHYQYFLRTLNMFVRLYVGNQVHTHNMLLVRCSELILPVKAICGSLRQSGMVCSFQL